MSRSVTEEGVNYRIDILGGTGEVQGALECLNEKHSTHFVLHNTRPKPLISHNYALIAVQSAV